MSHQITPSTARNLFKLAHDIRNIEPWKDFSDSDWFGIKDPESGEIQIVAIMGMAEQVFSIQLYLPEEGIRFWNDLLAGKELDTRDMVFSQHMLECEFCDTPDLPNLPEEDIEFYDTYGIKDPRPHALPVFRKTEPELYPWFLEEKDAHLLCHALVLTQRFHSQRSKLLNSFHQSTGPDGLPEIPLFTLKKDADPADASNWGASRCQFPKAKEKTIPDSPADDLFLNRFHKIAKKATCWEIASSYIPQPSRDDIQDDADAPYYPVLTLCIDPNSEAHPLPDINHPHKDKASILRKNFSQAAENYAYLPTELHVSTPLAVKAFEGIQEAYGIKVILKRTLPAISTLLPSIASALSGQLPDELLQALESEDFDLDSLPPEMRAHVENLFNRNDEDFDDDDLEYTTPTSTSRYILRIDIKGAKPPIWRRISIPTDATFYDLHHAIQDAFDWENEHLHQFELKNKYSRIIIQPDEGDCGTLAGFNLQTLDEFTTPISQIAEAGIKKMTYTYDFGDNWKHSIKIEKTITTDIANPLPTILKGSGASLPEDCGGLYGYYALMDPDNDFSETYHEEYLEEIRNNRFDLEGIFFESPADIVDITPGYDVEPY